MERGCRRACGLPYRLNAQLCPPTGLRMLCQLPQPTGTSPNFWTSQACASPAPPSGNFPFITNYPSSESLQQGLRLGHLHVSGPAQHRCQNPATRPSVSLVGHGGQQGGAHSHPERPHLRPLPGRSLLVLNPRYEFIVLLFTFFLEGGVRWRN